MRDLRSQRHSARPLQMNGKTWRVYPSALSCLVVAERAWYRLLMKRTPGIKALSLVLLLHPRKRRRQQALSANCVAIPWRCCRFVVTTWPTIGNTGSISALKRAHSCPRSFMSIGSGKTRTAALYGLDSERIPEFSNGSSSVVKEPLMPLIRQSGGYQPLTA